MKLPTPKFEPGALVYPKVASDGAHALMVTGLLFRPGVSTAIYLVTDANGDETQRLECELTSEKSFDQ